MFKKQEGNLVASVPHHSVQGNTQHHPVQGSAPSAAGKKPIRQFGGKQNVNRSAQNVPNRSGKNSRSNQKFNGSKGLSNKRQAPALQSNAKSGNLRITPLGGNEEVGRNMTVFEYDSDIIILDMGIQFPEEDMPGIDYIIPNVNYLENKTSMIKGVIITHGHMDHVGGIPHLMGKLGNPPMFMGKLTAGIVKKLFFAASA